MLVEEIELEGVVLGPVGRESVVLDVVVVFLVLPVFTIAILIVEWLFWCRRSLGLRAGDFLLTPTIGLAIGLAKVLAKALAVALVSQWTSKIRANEGRDGFVGPGVDGRRVEFVEPRRNGRRNEAARPGRDVVARTSRNVSWNGGTRACVVVSREA